eukprot:554209_1
MSSKLYKKGKLRKSSEVKLRKRLQKEKNGIVNKKGVNKEIKEETKKEIETSKMPKQETKTEKQEIKLKELTIDDIEDTPPPQKLVLARKKAMNSSINDVNWISLINYNQNEAENEEMLYKKLEKQSNNRFKTELDKQILIKKKQKKSQLDKKK